MSLSQEFLAENTLVKQLVVLVQPLGVVTNLDLLHVGSQLLI